MRDDLLIPCDRIPGLLRRGSPVAFFSVRDAVAVTVSGVVVDVGPDRATVASADRALVGSRALMDLSLDLSDDTGAFHACQYLGLEYPCWLVRADADLGLESEDGTVCLTDWLGQFFEVPGGEDFADVLGIGADWQRARAALARVVLARAGVDRA